MKIKTLVSKKKCRACPYNEFRRCGSDFCVRALCIYEEEMKRKIAEYKIHKMA